MRDTMVVSFLGADRPGLVEAIAAKVAAAGGNWEESRMARLAGQFAGILLITVERDRADELIAGVRALDATGLQVLTGVTAPSEPPPGTTRVRLDLTGNDRPGIVRDVSRVLAERGVNVEALESSVESAPMTGEPLFRAHAVLRVPIDGQAALRAALEALAGELMVDLAAD